VPVTFRTQVTVEYDPDGAGRHLVNLRRATGVSETARHAALGGADLDAAIWHARAALAALLRAAVGDGSGEESPLIAEARALLSTLLDHRIDLAAERLGHADPVVVAAVRADRDEAIAVSGALLYWLPAGDPAWPEVALTVGRLSYDRYRDSWPKAAPPDPTTSTPGVTCCCMPRGTRTSTSAPRCTWCSRCATGTACWPARPTRGR